MGAGPSHALLKPCPFSLKGAELGRQGGFGGFLMLGVWLALSPRGPAGAREGRGQGFVSGNMSTCF